MLYSSFLSLSFPLFAYDFSVFQNGLHPMTTMLTACAYERPPSSSRQGGPTGLMGSSALLLRMPKGQCISETRGVKMRSNQNVSRLSPQKGGVIDPRISWRREETSRYLKVCKRTIF